MGNVRFVIKKFLNKISAEIKYLSQRMLFFLARHYTALSMVVIFISGTIFFFTTEYLFRYSKWNWWNWKTRAIKKTIYLFIILVLIKIILLGELK